MACKRSGVQLPYHGPPNWCEVFTEEPVSEKVCAHFVNATKIESEFKPDMTNWGVGPRPPQSVSEIADKVYDRMYAFVLRTANLITWRVGVHRSGKTIHKVASLSWSDDGAIWEPVPGTRDFSLLASAMFWPPDFGGFNQISPLLESGLYEPLGHQLLREANLIRHSSPRSALLIAITAAEVGFKELVSRLVPDAEWLAMHAPSPPLIQMLKEYLPKLPVKARIGGPDFVPFIPDNVLDILQKGIKKRNEATHQGKEISSDTLEEVIGAVEDLLWILDCYAAFPWVANRISGPTVEAMDKHVKRIKALRK
ncbi:MAG: hypothetical protein V4719_18290 [Planctomycetota bacterium]